MIYSKLFEEILINPILYVGNCNIQHITFFISGFIHANRDLGNKDKSDPYFGFQNWVANYYEVSKTLGWAKIITLYSSSEEHAFDITVKLWNEYKSEMQK